MRHATRQPGINCGQKRIHFAKTFLLCVLAAAASAQLTLAQNADPLPSWNDGETKQSIVDFVTKVAKKASPDFVLQAERITVIDNDGTLWSEQPMYFQLSFASTVLKRFAHCAGMELYREAVSAEEGDPGRKLDISKSGIR